ncbi:hypothetical protein BB561_001094 [Smittium simulii]|uniref:Uncharacterized protein n=1 Tax=Smittium simulii TaxID=133385 RepID=A0A2T9YW78_9FUNG|nr:hypothetical protein BB561_001094 [Smittium simulii]
MSGVSYNPLLRDNINIIAESANSVLNNFFTRCDIGETISKFTAREDGQQRFKDLADKDVFRNIKDYNDDVDFNYILLCAYILESSIDSPKFALKVFNKDFVKIQELEKPIYLQVQSKKKLEDKSFLM